MDAFHNNKWNVCKVVRKLVKNDPKVISAFNQLLSCAIPKMDGNCDLKESIRTRIMRRYLNMRCKEFVKVVKREFKCEKEKLHRQKVQEKTRKKDNNTRNLICQLCNDSSEGKNASFYTIKALAATGKDSFIQLTKKEIHFLFHLFELTFRKSMNKTKLCEELTTCVNNAHVMTNPSLCSVNELNSIGENKKCTKCSSTREVPETLPNQASIPPSAHCAQSNNADQNTMCTRRRKQFRPTIEQKQILEEDHGNGLTPEIISQRASEFGVHTSQIESWHKRFRSKNKSVMH